MYTIVGLGNPGAEYEHTRHNVGWIIISDIVSRHALPSFSKSSRYGGQLSEGVLHDSDVGVLFPTTFMNNSGTGTAKYLKENDSSTEELIVVHDDIDLALGEVKVSFDRGAGGHNGVKSIIDVCGAKFIRIRVGIAPRGFFGGIKRPSGEKLSQYVLGGFKAGELKSIAAISEKVDTALTLILQRGAIFAMQEVNRNE